MSSIFEIQQDLIDVFEEIESNEGILTEELEDKLTITQDRFKEKIKSYADYIKHLEGQIQTIKVEKQRLDDLKKSKEKTIERLKDTMAYAINMFGDVNKSGNHYVEYDTGKVTVRPTESVSLDSDRIDNINQSIMGYFYHKNMIDESVEAKDVEELIDDINKFYNSTITSDDLSALTDYIKIDINLLTLLSNANGIELFNNIVKSLITNDKPINSAEFIPDVSKTTIKNALKEVGTIPSFANIETKNSVIIK